MWIRNSLTAALTALSVGLPAAAADASVTLVVANAAGARVRSLATFLKADTDRTWIVENRPGANGALAIGSVAAAGPDGTTPLFLGETSVFGQMVQQGRMVFDDGLIGVANHSVTPSVIAVNPDLVPITDFTGLVAFMRENPDTFYGTIGVGPNGHLMTESIAAANGLTVEHVPYTGSAPPKAIATFAAAVEKATQDARLQELARAEGSQLLYLDRAQIERRIRADVAAWVAIVTERGIRPGE